MIVINVLGLFVPARESFSVKIYDSVDCFGLNGLADQTMLESSAPDRLLYQ